MFDEMFATITGNPVDPDFHITNRPGTNRLNFLIGDVGVGKSLLAIKLISVCEANNSNNEGNYYLLPVYLDFELFLMDSQGEFKDIDERFIEIIIKNIKIFLQKREKWSIEFDLQDQSDNSYNQFIKLNLILLKNRIRLFIIMDNTDRYHFYYSKYTFFDEYKNKQSATVQKNFSKIFNIFSRTEILGDQGLAILFVCRRSVFKFWMSSYKPEDNQRSFIEDYGAFQIQKIDEVTAIKSRLELMAIAISEIEKVQSGKAKDYNKIVKELEDVLMESLSSKGRNTLSLIKDLTHHGTRSFIEFLCRIRIDYRDQYAIYRRLFHDQPHNLLRIYITNLNRRFAQYCNHFPNIFLVDAVIAPDKNFPNAHIPHKHTYWLKYLLLSFIVKRAEEGEVITFNELYEIFVDVCKYEDHLFRLALGSLNTVNSYQCIEIDESGTDFGDCIRIKPTLRGKTLISIDSNETPNLIPFIFEFDYLQFVVDDPQLALPNQWRKSIYVQAHIGYLMSSTPAYTSALRGYLDKKSKAVLYFLHVIDAASKVEMESLKGCNEIISLIPDFSVIWDNYFKALSRIFEKVPKSEELHDEIKNIHNTLTKENDKMIDFFREFYSQNILVGPP